MSEITLKVNDTEHGGWESVDLTRSAESLSPSVTLSYSEEWFDSVEPSPIVEGDAVEVLCDGDREFLGWVDEDGIEYDANSHTVSVSCRAKTCDLIDCSAIHAGNEWRGVGLLKIAKDLCDMFGLTVRVQSGLSLGAAFPVFPIQDGETCFECLDRAARMRGVALATGDDGNLVIWRSESFKVETTIERGVNVLRGTRRVNGTQRYSQYIVKAQAAQSADSDFPSHALKATETDAAVTRYRPLVVMAEEQATGAELRERAKWERNTRAGRSRRFTYVLQGWHHDAGTWRPNTLVHVKDPTFRLDDWALIMSVRLAKSNDQGELVTLELCDRHALDIEPLHPRPNKKESIMDE